MKRLVHFFCVVTAHDCHIMVVLVPCPRSPVLLFMMGNIGNGSWLGMAKGENWKGPVLLVVATRLLLGGLTSSTLAILDELEVASWRSILALFTAANWAGESLRRRSGALGAD